MKDLTGQRFGRLVITGFLYMIKGKSFFECLCNCGKYDAISANCLIRGRNISCGCYKSEVNVKLGKSNFKSGRKTDKYGYVYILTNGKYIQEHRLVMQDHIGRELHKKETVHHKNGIRSDNTISNLELWTGNHSHGQRVSDLIEYSLQILKEYRPELLVVVNE